MSLYLATLQTSVYSSDCHTGLPLLAIRQVCYCTSLMRDKLRKDNDVYYEPEERGTPIGDLNNHRYGPCDKHLRHLHSRLALLTQGFLLHAVWGYIYLLCRLLEGTGLVINTTIIALQLKTKVECILTDKLAALIQYILSMAIRRKSGCESNSCRYSYVHHNDNKGQTVKVTLNQHVQKQQRS